MRKTSLEKASQPIIERVVEAHVKNDYPQLLSIFDGNPHACIPPSDAFNDAVKEAIEPLGNALSFTYLGNVNKKNSNLLLWKVSFEYGEEELLWHLYLTDNMVLTALWFG
ncbi:hypothetical protein DRW07_03960 [Alteromonas sediminis]|uniref:Nuclear transport factor 2 family protein n=1 Tax=Alteromonas sediminis TaxID=2259342 RepID=A0A3N5Y3F9_9ALTE|nr:hypothetical protein [Alteromonas sediminis]RPJ68567.1 hypothetical protein DRW07_03960 [Alteromonas sediminis]